MNILVGERQKYRSVFARKSSMDCVLPYIATYDGTLLVPVRRAPIRAPPEGSCVDATRLRSCARNDDTIPAASARNGV